MAFYVDSCMHTLSNLHPLLSNLQNHIRKFTNKPKIQMQCPIFESKNSYPLTDSLPVGYIYNNHNKFVEKIHNFTFVFVLECILLLLEFPMQRRVRLRKYVAEKHANTAIFFFNRIWRFCMKHWHIWMNSLCEELSHSVLDFFILLWRDFVVITVDVLVTFKFFLSFKAIWCE